LERRLSFEKTVRLTRARAPRDRTIGPHVTSAALFVAWALGCGGRLLSEDVHDSMAASGTPVDDSSLDVSSDGASEATTSDDASDADLFDPCSGGGDVFHWTEGPYPPSQGTYTSLNAVWRGSYDPSSVDVVFSNDGGAGSIHIGSSVPVPAPGTYSLQQGQTAVWLEFGLGGTGCYLLAGTLTILQLDIDTTDASSSHLRSLKMAFDIYCEATNPPDASNEVRACLSYSQ
jgi:hypothetical protein